MISKPLLIQGHIMHKRFSPKINQFKYKSTYISFPFSQKEQLSNRLFSVNKFNLFSFNDTDHQHISVTNDILRNHNLNNIKDIVLITHPRVLGYVFNPVSFWLCFDDKQQLIAVLSEVCNTYKQKHYYLCFNKDFSPIKPNQWLEAQKVFYVSPFLKIEGSYKFRFEYCNDQMNFYINYMVDDKLKLSTYLKCDFVEFNARNILQHFLKIPFATFKTVFLIHYQALKLYLKSIPFYSCPKKLKNNLTINEK